MKKTTPKTATLGLLVVFVVVVGARVLLGQGQAGGRQREHSQTGSSAPQEIFCLAKSAGQLCNHGSADVLKLDGVKRQGWNEAANRYNKAVDAATKQLLEEAKTILSPAEFARVEKWFDKSLNAQLNRQLLAASH